MEITKKTKYNFEIHSEIEDMEFQIKYGTKIVKAAKKYLTALQALGGSCSEIQAQKLRSEYDKDIE